MLFGVYHSCPVPLVREARAFPSPLPQLRKGLLLYVQGIQVDLAEGRGQEALLGPETDPLVFSPHLWWYLERFPDATLCLFLLFLALTRNTIPLPNIT